LYSILFLNRRAFSFPWWFWLSATGAMLVGSVAVKFVGVFVVFLVGFRAIADLWEILGDLSRPVVCISAKFLEILSLIKIDLFLILLELHRQTFYGEGVMFDCVSSRTIYGHFLHPSASFVPEWPG
jgi:dolichyl-phosphate-mannose--protein O-mannosyl transferase